MRLIYPTSWYSYFTNFLGWMQALGMIFKDGDKREKDFQLLNEN